MIMECPVNTVKTRLFHARAKLRALVPGLAGAQPECEYPMNEHARASELLPWMVNGRIESAPKPAGSNGHLEQCSTAAVNSRPSGAIRDASPANPPWNLRRRHPSIACGAHRAGRRRCPAPGRSCRARGVHVRPTLRLGGVPGCAPRWPHRPRPLRAGGVLWRGPEGSRPRTIARSRMSRPRPTGQRDRDQGHIRRSGAPQLTSRKSWRAPAWTVRLGPQRGRGVHPGRRAIRNRSTPLPAAAARLRADPRVRFAEVGAQ